MSPAYHQVHAKGSTVMSEEDAIAEKGEAYDPAHRKDSDRDEARKRGIPPGPTGALREQTDPLNPANPAGSSKIDDRATELARENANEVRENNPERLDAESKQRDPDVIKALNDKNDELQQAAAQKDAESQPGSDLRDFDPANPVNRPGGISGGAGVDPSDSRLGVAGQPLSSTTGEMSHADPAAKHYSGADAGGQIGSGGVGSSGATTGAGGPDAKPKYDEANKSDHSGASGSSDKDARKDS